MPYPSYQLSSPPALTGPPYRPSPFTPSSKPTHPSAITSFSQPNKVLAEGKSHP